MNDRGAITLTPRAKALMEAGGGQVRGYVPVAAPGGKVDLVPWTKAPRVTPRKGPTRWNPKVMVQNIPVPEHVQKAMLEGLPPEIRRTPRERYKVLVTRLVHDAMKAKREFGRVIWPKSIEDEIRRLSWLEGDPTLLQRIENGATEAIEKFAGSLMENAARNQRAKDQHKVALDWHGHYNT